MGLRIFHITHIFEIILNYFPRVLAGWLAVLLAGWLAGRPFCFAGFAGWLALLAGFAGCEYWNVFKMFLR